MGIDFSDLEFHFNDHWVEAGINVTPVLAQHFADWIVSFFNQTSFEQEYMVNDAQWELLDMVEGDLSLFL